MPINPNRCSLPGCVCRNGGYPVWDVFLAANHNQNPRYAHAGSGAGLNALAWPSDHFPETCPHSFSGDRTDAIICTYRVMPLSCSVFIDTSLELL